MAGIGENIYNKIENVSVYSDQKTFRQAAEEWLKNIRSKVASTTYDRYLDTLNRDIYPEYSDLPMNVVTVEEMNRFLRLAPDKAKERGRSMSKRSALMIKTVMGDIIRFSGESEYREEIGISPKGNAYKPLNSSELEILIRRAKFNHCTEMLAVLLSLYCGMRIGELSALSCDDVNIDRKEIYIHRIAHRIKNPGDSAEKKTIVVVEEISRKNQIRTVSFPGLMKEYIEEFMVEGRYLIRNNKDDGLMDMRTLKNRMNRIMSVFQLDGISFERLRKTYMSGKADVSILNNIFLGKRPDRPYEGTLDTKWLTDEMKRDLLPLRTLIGFSENEMGDILGIPENEYKNIETGNQDINWDQYMSMLFVFHYNGRTMDVVDSLGLYPESLRERLDIRKSE